jgi:hypothetical protein
MSSRMYFETADSNCPIKLNFYEDTKDGYTKTGGAWADFVRELDIESELWKSDANFDVSKYWEDGKEVWVWNIDEDWKHDLIERLVCIDIDHIEIMIANIGIRNVVKLSNDTGLIDDLTMDKLSTDMGMRMLFYCVLSEHLEILDNQHEITEAEWKAWERRNLSDDEDEDEDP